MEDQKTRDYFDQFTPQYKPERFDFAIEYLAEHAGPSQNLIDIGCGDGTTLYLIKKNTKLTQLSGLDISINYLNKARSLVGCDIIQGSILDDDIVERYSGQFDFCTLGAVLHHLIGSTRAVSFNHAMKCVENALQLLKPNGRMIIFEPCYGPSFLMDIVFWIKKTFGSLTSGRFMLFKRWMNIGQPVVSYYTPKQLRSFIDRLPNARVVKDLVIDNKRLGLLIARTGLGLIIQRTD